MVTYAENIKSILPFFQGLLTQITVDNISILSEISNKINFIPLQKVSSIFNIIQNQNIKIKELFKIESSLSKINENNVEKTKYQIIQSFLTKEQKYNNLLMDILIYYSKIRPEKTTFYIKLIESLIQSNSNNRKSSSTSQSSMKTLTMTANSKRIIKPQTKNPQNRTKLSSTLQLKSTNKVENIETNEYSNILIKELKNSRIRIFFSNCFLFQLFSNSIITSKKQKLAILSFVKESNSDELKEWFSSSLKALTKDQLSLYNKYTECLNEEPIREAIRNDDVNAVKSILSQKNKINKEYSEKSTLNNKIVFDFYTPKQNKSIFMTEYAAIFGSINCFKYFLTIDCKMPRNILKKAIRGGDFEIINLCIEKGFKINNNNEQILLNTSIKYHRNKIFKWLLNSNTTGQKERISKNPSICISTYNFKAFVRTQFDNFNFIFELIDYNNIILIELIMPFLHSFIRLIMSYYSIINHSNEIATCLYESIDEICYPFDYLQQLNQTSDKLKFNIIIKACHEDKFEKDIIFILFCFITDNIDFLKYLLLFNPNNQLNKKEKVLLAFKALNYSSQIFDTYKLTSCLKFVFSFISGFINEEQVISSFENYENENNSFLLLMLFEQFNNLHLKFSKTQMNSIVLHLLKMPDCRSILFKNYKQFVSNECLLEFLDEIKDQFEIYFELISYENIDVNVILTSYLNKISLKFRPESRENRFNSSLTYRRLTTSFNEREKEKDFINLCSTRQSFDINYEVDDDRNSYLHLIVMNDLDYILRFIFSNPVFRQILNKCNKFNKTPLLMAFEYQNIECIQTLIEQNGVNFLLCDISEMNAFNYAIQNNLLDFVSRIIEIKNKTNQNSKNRKNAKNENVVIDIVNSISKNRRISPICCSKTKEMIELLLDRGAAPSTFNGVDKDGKTLLVKSLENHSYDFQYLLSNLSGIDINGKCQDGKTFVMRAIELNKYQQVIDYLENNPIQNDQKQATTKSSISNSAGNKSSLSNSAGNKSSLSNSAGNKSSLSNSAGNKSSLSNSTGNKSSLSNSAGNKSSLSNSTGNKSSLLNSAGNKSSLSNSTGNKSSLSNSSTFKSSISSTEGAKLKSVSVQEASSHVSSYAIDYSVKSRENSYLASALRANNSDLIEKFLLTSLKSGNDQAALIESMKQASNSSIATKLMASIKKKLEPTPRQVIEDIVQIPEKYFEFVFKETKDPNKAFNSVYNDQTILTSSIKNNNNSLIKFLLSKNELINLDLNWCNSKGMNCFDIAIESQNQEITEILFKEEKLNKSLQSFSKIIIQKNKFSCSLKLNETMKNKWISETLKKKKVQLFIEIIENNNVDLFNLVFKDIDDESLINKGFSIAILKRNENIISSFIDNELLNSELSIKLAIEQNNAALFKKLVLKYNDSVNMNKFVELMMVSNQSLKNVYLSYAKVSEYTKRLLQNENDFSFTVHDVCSLLQTSE